MKDVSNKPDTLRTAVAGATLQAAPETIEAVRNNAVPKGSVLDTARIAGIQAAKQTPNLLPLCHSLPLDHAEVRAELGEHGIHFTATVTAVWKTGVEMEALMAASTAALCAYDMLKPLNDDTLQINDVKLLEKRGGKSSLNLRLPDRTLRAAVLVTSDGTAAGTREDRSGKIIKERLEQLGLEVVTYEIVPDDAATIRDQVLSFIEARLDLVLTTGGTGLSPRDVTAETIASLIEQPAPGVAEAMRSHGQRRTPFAMLSQGVAGTTGSTMLVTLPGSSKGAAESLDALFPALLHAIPMMAAGGHD